MSTTLLIKRAAFLAAGAALCAWAGTSAFAGAWTPARGGWYLEESFNYFKSNQDFNENRERETKPNNGEFHQLLAKTYIEYGVVDALPLILSMPYKRLRYVDDYSDIDNAGFQDAQIGTRWKYYERKSFVASVSVSVTFPMSQYSSDDPLPLGDRNSNPEIRFLVGQTFLPVTATMNHPGWSRAYAGAEVGKDRTGVPYVVEGGVFPVSWLLCKFAVTGFNDLPTAGTGQDYVNWMASIVLTSEGANSILRTDTRQALNLILGYGNTWTGRNTGLGPNVQVSLAYSF